jgi:hypothetical protein
MKLTFALLVLFLSSSAFADSTQAPVGPPLYYPDGSTVTFVGPMPDDAGYAEVLNYTFADGTGESIDPIVDGEVGFIDFTTPVTSLTFNYVWENDQGSPFTVMFLGTDETFSSTDASGTATVTGDITDLQWIGGFAEAGDGGITSMSYTLDPPVSTPEPSSLDLASWGLFGCALWLARKRKARA